MMKKKATPTAGVHAVDSAPVAVSRALHVTQGPAVISRPIPAPVARSSITPIAPIFAGLCCLGLILFLIAATIILSLIPLYTPIRNEQQVARTEPISIDNQIANDTIIDVGDFNGQQRALLQSELQNVLNSNLLTSDALVSVVSSTALTSTRVAKAKFVRSRIVITYRRGGRYLKLVIAALSQYVISAPTATELVQLATPPTTTTTTTVPPTTTTTVPTTTTVVTNASRVLVRRSLKDGGAPAGIVYVDSHQVAAISGKVKSVSFYIDQTCAMATVEFAAFELMERNLGINTAQLTLTARSGALKLGSEKDLKPYMTQITIRLCSGDLITDKNSGGCQGLQFPVLAHQYLGIRSDTCRLGFAATPVDPVVATTWKVADGADPFATPQQKINYIPSNYTVLQSAVIDSGKTDAQGAKVEQKTGAAKSPRVLFIGSYSPRRCGLATFLSDVTANYPGPYGVVACDESSPQALTRVYGNDVVYRLNETNREAYFAVADIANSEAYDVVNIQHEYGLYGGMAGEYVIALIAAIRKPVIVTMHTVIPKPSNIYLSVTRAVCATATKVIVLADLGRHILTSAYEIEETKIVVIPHGVPDIAYSDSLAVAKDKLGYEANVPTMATFGLVHRNKNIQLGLKAMAHVIKEVPNAMYMIIGQTHPMVQLYEGEAYRRELEGNVSTLGLTKNVEFIDEYVNETELLGYLAGADIYLTPYVREDQYVSGTLAWAVGLGKAVVSTPYLYAKELLADGRGFLVPFEDHEFLGSTIANLMQDDVLRNGARRHAYKFGRRMTWPVIGRRLEELFRELLLFT